MRIILSGEFVKKLNKLPKRIQEQFSNRRDLFLENPFYPLLNNHTLQGKYAGCRSINVTGDFRVIYEPIAPDVAYFILIGTHAELYE